MSEARQAVTPVQEREIATAEPTALIDVIARAVADPSTDVEKMERLLAMHERITAQRAKVAYTQALADLQPELPVIDEKGAIRDRADKVQSTYARWEDINDAIRPLLHAHGFALSFRPGVANDGQPTVTAVLRHREGHEEEATVKLPIDSSGSKNNVQGVGSSLSYGKRYSAIAILNLTSRAPEDRDDDGRAAGRSQVAQHAITEINMAEGLDALRAWRRDKFDGVSKMVTPEELKEIVALWNRRLKAAKGEGGSDA